MADEEIKRVERVVFKGLTESQLKELPYEKFLQLIDSRARRFLTRKSLQYKEVMANVEKAKRKGSNTVKTRVREAVILPEWVGMVFQVHNGKQYVNVEIKPEMVGRRLGEFVYTVQRVVHSTPGIKATKSSRSIGQK
ncbi:MAG: 30S ribosomal protein S19 [Candidatus Micrarchaeota archaeon]|nr:MAG: 30S ribosomal protein S19 [Candidatus Micrarchaeota archaeon]